MLSQFKKQVSKNEGPSQNSQSADRAAQEKMLHHLEAAIAYLSQQSANKKPAKVKKCPVQTAAGKDKELAQAKKCPSQPANDESEYVEVSMPELTEAFEEILLSELNTDLAAEFEVLDAPSASEDPPPLEQNAGSKLKRG